MDVYKLDVSLTVTHKFNLPSVCEWQKNMCSISCITDDVPILFQRKKKAILSRFSYTQPTITKPTYPRPHHGVQNLSYCTLSSTDHLALIHDSNNLIGRHGSDMVNYCFVPKKTNWWHKKESTILLQVYYGMKYLTVTKIWNNWGHRWQKVYLLQAEIM